ncbi:MAG: hypothetical protein CMJ32_01705 [Phycisphaerae bacterium]|nr:hypothetical protein [Phycisphaerae bacterium]
MNQTWPLELLLVAQAVSTFGMLGVIWLVQLVNYPLKVFVPSDEFVRYQARHMRRITVVVGPLMLVEAGSSAWLVLLPLEGPMMIAAWIGMALVMVLWISTLVFQIPAHRKLEREKDQAAIASLVRFNWVRTIVWTARAGVVAWMMVLSMTA